MKMEMHGTLLFIVNVDWFFISHRLPIALETLNKGLDVHVACADTGKHDYLRALGFKVHELPLSRSGAGVLSEGRAFKSIYNLIQSIKPRIVHLVTIKPVLYGGIACRFLNVPKVVASISGLGYVFTDSRPTVRALRFVLTLFYRFALNKKNVAVIFQNTRDRDLFKSKKIVESTQINMIRGSGASLEDCSVLPQPDGPVVFMFLARLLKDKGLVDFVEAAKLVLNNGVAARFVVVGNLDPENPNAVSAEELQSWVDDGVIEYWGFTDNAPRTISKSHVMVLPSFYAEGLPKSLIEAAACGRAVITTDMPGCRDAIELDVTGLLVPAKNPARLAEAMEYLADAPSVRERMGREGRRLAEEVFDINSVVQKHLEIYGLDEVKI